jgi:glyoxylase-like metal-dependent hydrolase (beta-lactamase superfamily II)
MIIINPSLIQRLTLLVLSLVASGSAQAQTDVARMSGAGQDIRKIVIADNIYQFMTMRDSYVRMLNSVVIVNDNDVLVFDTNTRPSSARLILAEIRKMTDKPVRFVVNSQWHPDHWSGNEVYAKAVHDGLQTGIVTLDEMYKAVTVAELRERFTHKDEDLEARYSDRVKAIVRLAIREARGQDFPP